MLRLRIVILCSLLFILIFTGVQCQYPADAGMAPVSCSPFLGANQITTIGTEDGTNIGNDGYTGPIAIPVTIAKLDGIDASTVNFVLASNRQFLVQASKNGVTQTRLNDSVMGTLYMKPILRSTSCPQVGVVVNGEFVNTLSATLATDCLMSDVLLVSDAEVPRAYVVLPDGFSTSTALTASSPVIVEVKQTSNILEQTMEVPDYVLQVYVTNMSSDNEDPETAYDVNSTQTASVSEDIVFAAQSANSSNTSLLSVPNSGGSPTWLADHALAPLGFLSSPNALSYFLDSDTKLYLLDGTSVDGMNMIGFAPPAKTDPALWSSFSIHPNDNYIVYQVSAQNPTTLNTGMALGLLDQTSGQVSWPIFIKDQSDDFTNLEMTWINQSEVVLFAHTTNAEYQVWTLDMTSLSFNAGDGVYYVDETSLFSTTEFVGQPAADNNQLQHIYYLCADNAATNNLCQFDLNTQENTTLIDANESITSFALSRDGLSYLVYALGEDPALICYHFFETEENVCRHFGNHPVPSWGVNPLVFFTNQLSGTNQVGLYNLREDPLANRLEFVVENAPVRMGRGDKQTIKPSGGIPPYNYELVSGVGTLNTATGEFVAPSNTGGTATIRVSDQTRSFVDITITIPESGLDQEFGENGRVTFADSTASGSGMILQPDNKMVVVGTWNSQFLVVRYNPNGTLDSTFGTNGIVTTSVGNRDAAYANCVARQADGKLVVAGIALVNDSIDFALVRYEANGTLDKTFGDQGMVTTDMNGNTDRVYSVSIHPKDQTILVTGSAEHAMFLWFTEEDAVLARYTTQGILDTSFNGTGIFTDNISMGEFNDLAFDAQLDSQDRIVVGGRAVTDGVNGAILMRFLKHGELDSSFGDQGIVRILSAAQNDTTASKIFIQDGVITAAGIYNDVDEKAAAFVAKFLEKDGSFLTSFADQGIALIQGPHGENVRDVYSMAIDGSDRIVLSAALYPAVGPSQGLLIRVDPSSGEVDQSFANSGYLLFEEILVDGEYLSEVTIGTDQRILVVGSSFSATDLSLRSIWP